MKAELSNLSQQLKSRMDELLEKDGLLLEKEAQLVGFKDELTNLSSQLQSRMDEILLKDGQLTELRQELEGIYNSEGYRYLLRPLWSIIWHSRAFLKKFRDKIAQFLWRIITIASAPLFLLLGTAFFFEGLFWAILASRLKRRTVKRKIVPFEKLKVSLVIPNWNGVEYLKRCLPSIFGAKGFSNHESEVLMVDDGSTDGSVEFVRRNFPQVRLILNKKNRGFGFTCNRGVREAKNELIVLINNDIIVTEDFLSPLIKHFRDESVFAVTPKLYGWDRKTFLWGMHMGRFQDGYIRLWNEAETGNGDRITQTSPSIFAIGGAMVFRKSDFLWLGGFDSIYRPNCWEDIDICYRAWKRGLKVLYEPSSLLFHKGKATLTYERHKEIKNELVFTWRNITDKGILVEHLNLLPINLYRYKLPFLRGLLWALGYLPWTLAHRFKDRRYAIAGDRSIFDRCMLHYRNFMRRGFRHPKKDEKRHILLLASFMPYPLRSGGAIRIHTLARLLSHRYDISLLTLIHREEEVKFVPQLKKVFKEVYVIFQKSPIPGRLFPFRYKFAYSQELIDKFIEIQKNRPLDLIHIESNELLYMADFVEHIPIIYTEHDASILFFHKSYYQHKDGTLLGNFYDYLKRLRLHNKMYRRLDRVIVLSKQDEKILRAFFPYADINLLPTGVDLEQFSFQTKRNTSRRLIFIGHYPHYPNEDSIVYFTKKIFPLVRRKINNDVELMVVGSEPTQRVIQLSRYPNVRLIGTVEDVRPYLRDASVFVNSCRISAGIKGKVLEAMAIGRPVVSTRVGSSGIEARNNQQILLADSPQEFADAVVKVLKDENLYSRLAINARRLVEKRYSWHSVCERLGRLYEYSFYDDRSGYAIAIEPESPTGTADILGNISARAKAIIEDNIGKKRLFVGAQFGPQELHLELTYSCNSRCIMCDLWDYKKRTQRKDSELSLEEIRRFVGESRHLKKVRTVVLSGGEPFLRPDLIDICGLFSGDLLDASIGILTNGVNTDTIVKSTLDILERHRPQYLWLGSSLDGMAQAHDYIRGQAGSFAALENTISRCKREKINICLTFTLTPFNIDQLVPSKRFADDNGVDLFIQFAVPKEARDRNVFSWSSRQLRQAEIEIDKILRGLLSKYDNQELLRHLQEDRFKGLLNQIYYLSHLVRYQRQPKRFFKKCLAGTRFAMFSPYGELYFCPGLKNAIVGDIRQDGFDSLWTSKKAQNMRDFVELGLCHCWLVCTVLPVIDYALSSREEFESKVKAS
jgi:GT2 family glycosyltransferase/MoaA/NifB/PqqE/SkfB family radical SAM enzyme/glycosyltransferase involved in cell wall biosynthesis